MKALRVLSALVALILVVSLVVSCTPPATPEPTAEAPAPAPTEPPQTVRDICPNGVENLDPERFAQGPDLRFTRTTLQ